MFFICLNRFLMVNHTTGSVMFTVLAFACGKSIVVTCHTQTSVLPMSHPLLSIRFALCSIYTPFCILPSSPHIMSTEHTFLAINYSSFCCQNLRPDIPRCCPSALANVMRKCWDANPDKRPDMDEVVQLIEALDTSKGGGMIPDGQSPGCLCFTKARGP